MRKKAIWILILIAIIFAIIFSPPVEGTAKKTKTNTAKQIKKPLEVKKTLIVYKKSFEKSDPRQDLIKYAYSKWWKDFLLTLDGENWLWTANRKSMKIGANWYWDYGICQLNKKYHKAFINSKEFKDPYRQIDYCFNIFQKALAKGRIKTTFYAYNYRHACAKRFENL